MTLGYSPCPNDTFIFHALAHGLIDGLKVHWDIHLEDVETLNEKAMTGTYDVTKLSVHAYGFLTDQYQLLNAGSALGFGAGPLLITSPENARRPVSEMRVAIPGKYTTAHFLFQMAYPEAKRKSFVVFSAIEDAIISGQVDAGVIIHENRFTYAKKGLEKIVDLGEMWERKTGMPIPLGGIAIRRSLAADRKQQINQMIGASVRHAFAHPEGAMPYISQHAQEMERDVILQHIDLYVNDYSVDLGQNGRQAVLRFLDEGLKMGLLPPIRQDIFLD